MGLLSKLLLAPVAPLVGVIWVAERLEEQAAAIYYSPQAVAEQLRELRKLRDQGLIGDAELGDAEAMLLSRLEQVRS